MAFTFFFRDVETLNEALKRARPGFQGRRYVDIWDAGCATGQEPFTVLILLREMMGGFAFRNVRMWATDIDEGNNCERFISTGIYPEEQVKRIPPALLERYFECADRKKREYRVVEEIRQAVRFVRSDLLDLSPPRDRFSLIVCKNVILHLPPSRRPAVIGMFHRVLTDDGYLVTEATQTISTGTSGECFETVPGHNGVHRRLESMDCIQRQCVGR